MVRGLARGCPLSLAGLIRAVIFIVFIITIDDATTRASATAAA
jgi:hypothetical protein